MKNLIPLNELFIPVYGTNLELINIEECDENTPDNIRFVSRTSKYNGISAYVKKIDEIIPNPANTISVAVSGSVLSSFYQDKEYLTYIGLDIATPKNPINLKTRYGAASADYQFLCLSDNILRCHYGR
ncbi:MAG: restriction endonuclease subunit S [Bacteroidetes bacterium]|nr:MAG: restriction endonuclease subunit S [Bacteroidota bacterium]